MKQWIERIQSSTHYPRIVSIIVVIGLLILYSGYRAFTQSQNQFDQELPVIADLQELASESIEVIEDEEVSEVTVEIKGSIRSPGVYTLPLNSRVVDLVELAEGFTEDAYIDQLNQAQKLEDQMMIYVYNRQAYESMIEQGITSNEVPVNPLNEDQHTSLELVNINTDNIQELLSLPGIGPKKAEAIQAYRRENGDFKQIEDLMEVTGIGQKTFDNLKELITVNSL